MQSDNEFESIISIVKSLKGDDEDLGIWEGSPFAWIKREPSRRVGKIGEQIVSAWCIQKGFVISKSHDSDADIVVNDRPIEIKFSTLWQSNRYTFQQLRDQNYEYAFFLDYLHMLFMVGLFQKVFFANMSLVIPLNTQAKKALILFG